MRGVLHSPWRRAAAAPFLSEFNHCKTTALFTLFNSQLNYSTRSLPSFKSTSKFLVSHDTLLFHPESNVSLDSSTPLKYEYVDWVDRFKIIAIAYYETLEAWVYNCIAQSLTMEMKKL